MSVANGSYSEISEIRDDIISIKESVQHVRGNLKAIDAGYAATTEGIIKNCDNLLSLIKEQSNRISNLETAESARTGRERFIAALIDKWPLIVAVIGIFIYVEHGSITFKNPLDKQQHNITREE